MPKFKWGIGVAASLLAVLAIYYVLQGEDALVVHPKGIVARQELNLMVINIFLMLSLVFPTFLFLLWVICRRRSQSPTRRVPQWILWTIPTLVVIVMALINWKATYQLDPYKSLESPVEPLTIQVVAMDWKWLFIYPQQNIATVNFVHFPEKRPIRFELSADNSPMNSFWIPELSGQIYSMTGMVTPLHLMADGVGDYRGRAAEINGDGYAKMTFLARSSSSDDFEKWIAAVKESPLRLSEEVYRELLIRSQSNPVTLYSSVEENLFNKIVHKYMMMP